MKKWKLLYFVSFAFIIFLSTLLNPPDYVKLADKENYKTKNNFTVIKSESDPIFIDSDDDFSLAYNFPGSGTKEDPYLISNRTIITTSDYGIYIFNVSKFFKIQNNIIKSSKYSIYIESIANNSGTILNNSCENNAIAGIFIKNSKNIVISNNSCNFNYEGISVIDCYNITSSFNNCSFNSYGIKYNNSPFSIIESNFCDNNSIFGIDCRYGNKSLLLNNQMNNNAFGLRIEESANCNVASNSINSSTRAGALISKSYYCEFTYNNFTDNIEYGLIFSNSKMNKIHRNNFINNSKEQSSQAFEDDTNIWYDIVAYKGNFWSDYKGKGNYTIGGPTLNSDPYPILNPTLVYHDNIKIYSNSQFYKKYLFPGSGTKEDPFIIEDIFIYTNFGIGIYIGGVNASFIIRNCIIYSREYGIYINKASSSNNEIINNTCRTQNQYGIFIENSVNTIVVNNTCSNQNQYSIYLYYSGHSFISNNTCSNSKIGIQLYYSGNTRIDNNLCISNEVGISLYVSKNCTIENNNCSYNSFSGIYISTTRQLFSVPAIIINNFIYNNSYFGIYLFEVDGSFIANNSIILNGMIGIYLIFSKYCIITYNNFINNLGYGLSLIDVEKTKIHHNNFFQNNINGTSQAFDDGCNNEWYDKEQRIGNFWSDLKDDFYEISGNANEIDKYPVKKPFLPPYNIEPISLLPNDKLNTNEIIVFFIEIFTLIAIPSFIFLFNKRIIRGK
ncbi:MAG: right-handed parallel beta-helix repeat-containing protein [Candidatus Heimdallarchaeum aukensis]|uniref:Right-handed parallel beta-helix repeat-containing protein n=1 Tax=Candidatus Heimdallarchaeum aukensis TaxID=2876573 RepID=A0A9Y1BME9_9ARCH|nr:MAG: right-handed parallel beta-helix repeat-containing protein [Candidatus Heimdallarchaeum aukensis]